MLPTGDEFGGFDTVSTQSPLGRPRGEIEIDFRNGWRARRHSVLTTSDLARDAFAMIKKAPALDGVTEYLFGVQSLNAAYHKGKTTPFSENDRELLEGILVEKTLHDLDEYKSASFGDAVAKAIRTIRHAVTASAMLSEGPVTKKTLFFVLQDRMRYARGFNPTVNLYAKEITMLARAADAGGIEIPEPAKKNVAFGLGEDLLIAIKHSQHLGEVAVSVGHVDAAIKALGVGYIPGHVAELGKTLIERADRLIERASPDQYGFTARQLKSAFETLGLEFGEEMKDHFYPRMVQSGLKAIYNTNNGFAVDTRNQMANNLVNGLELIGAPESSIAVEKIRLASVLARADIREYREKLIAAVRGESKQVVTAPQGGANIATLG